ncbi:hypothetical protein M8C21_028729, partial [Ambrosia artemisiifolia]
QKVWADCPQVHTPAFSNISRLPSETIDGEKRKKLPPFVKCKPTLRRWRMVYGGGDVSEVIVFKLKRSIFILPASLHFLVGINTEDNATNMELWFFEYLFAFQ